MLGGPTGSGLYLLGLWSKRGGAKHAEFYPQATGY